MIYSYIMYIMAKRVLKFLFEIIGLIDKIGIMVTGFNFK